MFNGRYLLLEVAGFLLVVAAAALLLHDLYRLYYQSILILNNQPRPAEVQLSCISRSFDGFPAIGKPSGDRAGHGRPYRDGCIVNRFTASQGMRLAKALDNATPSRPSMRLP